MPHTDTATRQKAIHHEQDRLDRQKRPTKPSATGKSPPRTAARAQPKKLPVQHLDADGQESDLALRPRFLAPDYLGSRKLQGQVALITGGDSGIGRAVAILYAREGADVVITYLSSDEDADETRRCVEAEGRQCLVLQSDVKSTAYVFLASAVCSGYITGIVLPVTGSVGAI